ncbi:hypothetical protein [Arthrobacter cavernae]|uniref:Uncharacterized protein n=1 Tax=Arthrobacter cavernae TaxID=2817681 RepID=A0A939KMJ0_9MICC|nr:hypothetical protein [Arthrobacter cavernae]MBO1268261.1 hypothetical protein [Arthrobacter cavernae]
MPVNDGWKKRIEWEYPDDRAQGRGRCPAAVPNKKLVPNYGEAAHLRQTAWIRIYNWLFQTPAPE